MKFEEFTEKFSAAVQEKLGENYSISIKEVKKNNGVPVHGMMISSGGGNVVPTIYLEHFYRRFTEGEPFEEVVEKLLEVYGNDVPEQNVDMEFFRDFEKVRDRICYRLVGRNGNVEMLSDMPYVEFLDMAVCFFYAYRGEILGEGSILIHNSHMEAWGCTVADLVRLAKRNTPMLFPLKCSTMAEMLRNLAGEDCRESITEEIPMRVLTNVQQTNGAVCLIYPGVLEHLADKSGTDLYILPSSIHETILLEDSGREDPRELKSMICQVNRTQVAPEEVLTDTLYRYDRTKKRVEVVL